jgi:drug/metabolite transporter (DMT)-like permease
MVKISNTGISPSFNAALRSVCAGTILFLWVRARGIPLFARDGTLWPGILCGVFFGLEFVFLYIGLSETPASRGTIFLHCAPFVAAYGEHLFVPGHRLTRTRVIGLLSAFLGLLIAMSDGHSVPTQATTSTLRGDVFCLLGGIFWGATTVIVRATNLKQVPAEKTLLYQLAVSLPLLLFSAWLLGEPGITNLAPDVQLAFAYTVVFVVVLGYTTWFWLMRNYSAASLHAFTFLTPLLGVLAGGLLLGEPLTTRLLAGLALVAAGIYIVNKPASA